MKLLLENWKKYLKEAEQMSMFVEPEVPEEPVDRWELLAPMGKRFFYDTWSAWPMWEEDREELEAKVDNMPEEEFKEMMDNINSRIDDNAPHYEDPVELEKMKAAVRLSHVLGQFGWADE